MEIQCLIPCDRWRDRKGCSARNASTGQGKRNDKSQLNRLIVEEISVSYLIDWLAAKLIDETYRKRENTPQI